MMKPICGKSKWLASLIILVITFLPIASCASPNQLPDISSLTADYEGEINPADSCQIECVASDPDEEDELAYTWIAYGGTISGTGSTVTWIAPNTFGICTISVEVSDGRDGIATEQINIPVLAPNNPPVIENMTTDCPRVKKAGTATIECVATDPDNDELTYTWSADRGTTSGEGPTFIWLGPPEYGTYTITVTVTDDRGGEATSTIDIIVCACGSACS